MRLPKTVQNLIESFQLLPGIGPKTAGRLTFYLLQMPDWQVERLGQAILDIKQKTKLCSICFNVGEEDPCQICSDYTRNKAVVNVVERPLDVLAFEKTGKFVGSYHVLHGLISPLNHIGPEELRIKELLARLKEGEINEVILSLNPTLEGEATAMYIRKLLEPLGIKVTRLASGLPVGADLEYADEVTLAKALEGREEY